MISFISMLKKLSKRVNGLHEIKASMADPSSLLCDCSKAKTARIIVRSITKPIPN